MGIYFIYLGAVSGSIGLVSSALTASFINREILPDDDSFKLNRFLGELLVSVSFILSIFLSHIYTVDIVILDYADCLARNPWEAGESFCEKACQTATGK